MKRIVAVSAVFCLAACSTGLLHQVSIPDSSKDMEQLDAAAQSRCASFGYQAGTPDFNKCVYGVKSQFLQSVMVPVAPPPAITPPPRAVTTNCSGNAFSATCTTY